jgi:putative iron-regulated protein
MRPVGCWAALACALIACDDGQGARSPVRQSVESLGRELFVPLTADFAHDAHALERALAQLCSARDAAALGHAREAWNAAAARFKQTEVMAFGPHTLSPWRLGAKIDFWPAREDNILEALRAHGGEPSAPAPARDGGTAVPSDRDGGARRADELGAAARGLPVIEYLLYAGGDDAVLAELSDVPTASARCAYLRELGANLVADARELNEAWRDSFAGELSLHDGPNQRFATIRESFGQIVNSLAFVVEDVRTRRLAKPFGGSRATAHPEVVESRFSARSIRDALDALQGVENVFTGRYARRQALGLGALLRARGRPLDRQLAHHLESARAALRAIPEPLDRAVMDDRKRVQEAIAALDALLVFLQVDVNQALAVTATFGAGDGD